MRPESKAPTCKVDDSNAGGKRETYSHPAYGTVGMSVVHGGDSTLFGSDIGHADRIRISINRAVLHRDLSHDWIHSRETLIEMEMSHSQFAQFITTPNRGEGIPCTLRYTAPEGTKLEAAPYIKPVETKMDMFRREIQEKAQERLVRMERSVKQLGTLIESGKITKTELRAIQRDLSLSVEHLPSSISYVVEQAEEALEKAQVAAKADIEAYVDQTARRLGLEKISDLKLLTNKEQK